MSVGVLYLCNIKWFTTRRNNIIYAKKDYFSSLKHDSCFKSVYTHDRRTLNVGTASKEIIVLLIHRQTIMNSQHHVRYPIN